jgi:nitroreductase
VVIIFNEYHVNKLQFLQDRVSISKLQSPPPNAQVLREVFKAAVRAADHGLLQPWRFLVIEGEGLQALSSVFVKAITNTDPSASPAVIEKCRNMPFRAPMIIVAIARCRVHPKIPKQEQVISCGAAVQNMLNAFFILGFGAMWRSGDMTQDAYVKNQLGLVEHEEIIGFVYVGTAVQLAPPAPVVDVDAFFTPWPVE